MAKDLIEQINRLVDLHEKEQSFRSCKKKNCKLCQQIINLGSEIHKIENKIAPERGEKVPALSERTIDDYLDLEETWTDVQISQMWNVEKKALSRWKKEHGLIDEGVQPKPVTISIAEYIGYKQDGLSDHKIAVKLGTTDGQVAVFKQRYNLNTKIYDYGHNGKS
ncbi:hypothetical protein EP56_05595 [Listeriaceae bacterium FSL A5-0209]|nr:hypothetical protein EP56_05595 [Listeriaceae bacterium FSL A5-0209]